MHGSMGDKIVNAHYVALQLELATTLYSNIFPSCVAGCLRNFFHLIAVLRHSTCFMTA